MSYGWAEQSQRATYDLAEDGKTFVLDENGSPITRMEPVWFIREWWQLPHDGYGQFVEYLNDPADNLPPSQYHSQHNEMISIKEDHWTEEENEEGYVFWIGGPDAAYWHPDETTTAMDEDDVMLYRAGINSRLYMNMIGLSETAEAIDEERRRDEERQQRWAAERAAILSANAERIRRVEITDDTVAARHLSNEESLYENYLRRRRERRQRNNV